MQELNAFSIPFQARVRALELREREARAQAGNASSRSMARDSALEQREAALADREAAMARASAAAEYARSEAEALWRNHKASPPLHFYDFESRPTCSCHLVSHNGVPKLQGAANTVDAYEKRRRRL